MKFNRRRCCRRSSIAAATIISVAVAVSSSAILPVVRGQAYVCDIVTCTNGLFNQAKCVCECIPPYCPDQFGACQSLAGDCGGNPWEGCTMGVNCPWWVNKLKEEGCTTGPEVPVDLWTIYNTQEACCASNFPYSSICDPVEPEPPTKYPTIALEEGDNEEIIPLQVSFTGLPTNISMSKLKEELETVLKRVLLRLAESMDNLKILTIEERVVSSLSSSGAKDGKETLYYNVNVLRVEGTKFGPTIITEIGDSYDEILSQIQSFSDTNNLGIDLGFNICTMNKGDYDLCAVKEVVTAAPRASPAKTSTSMESNSNEEGLAGWAIALIIILVLTLVCCGGYAIAVLCFGVTNCFKDPDDDPKDIQNNLYMDNRPHMPLEYEKRLAIMDSSRSEAGGTQRLAIMDGASRASAYNNYSIRSGAPSRRTIADEHQTIRSMQDPSFCTISTYGSKRKQARDPTMFIPGNEDRADPGTSVRSYRTRGGGESTSSSRRYYSEEPPLKPKREPTMYVDGNSVVEYPASKYLHESSSMRYDDVYSGEEGDSYVYNNGGNDRYGMGDGYDNASYGEVESCRTQEPSESRTRDPSVSGKSAFSKRSKVSKSSGVYSG